MRFVFGFGTAAGLCLLMATGTARAVGNDELERLLDAIARVESNGVPHAVGDSGRAVGIYQIHRAYWVDGTRILGVSWQYSQARDPVKARQVVRAYLSHYGKGKSLVDLARIHNGGPRGDEKPATQEYARKIKAALNASAHAAAGSSALRAQAGQEATGSAASPSTVSGA